MADSPPARRLRRDSEDGVSSYGVALNRSRAGKRKEEWFSLKFLPKGRFFRLPALNVLGIPPFHAEVVELVDTLGSGSSEGSFMGVRVSPSAPTESPKWSVEGRNH